MRPDRPHQTRALELLGESLARGRRAPLLQMPTGAGKTHVALRLCDGVAQVGKRAWWFAHREELVKQPLARILEDGWPIEQIRVVQAGRSSGLKTAALTICSIQTALAQDLVPDADLLILDEGRHYCAPEWRSILHRCNPGVRIVGLDATPMRGDGSPLGDVFDDLIVPTTVRELTDAGYLVPSVVYAPAGYQEELADDPIDAYRKHAAGSIAVVFCSNVIYARSLATCFRMRGIVADHVDAKTPEKKREAILERFAAGETRVLTNVRIATEGTDIPAIETVIHAGKCSTIADWIQKGGRGLRTSPGKAQCKVIDLHGLVHLYGLLDDPHEYRLSGAPIRLKEALPPIAQCPLCFAWGRSMAVCARCGAELPRVEPKPPRIKAAELQEIRRAETEDIRRGRLLRWALELRRNGAEGKTLWQIAWRYKGTYGEEPERHWVLSALDQSAEIIERERQQQEEAASPLFARR